MRSIYRAALPLLVLASPGCTKDPKDEALIATLEEGCACENKACAEDAKLKMFKAAMHVPMRADRPILEGITQHLEEDMPEVSVCLSRIFELAEKGSMAEQFDDIKAEAMKEATAGGEAVESPSEEKPSAEQPEQRKRKKAKKHKKAKKRKKAKK